MLILVTAPKCGFSSSTQRLGTAVPQGKAYLATDVLKYKYVNLSFFFLPLEFLFHVGFKDNRKIGFGFWWHHLR